MKFKAIFWCIILFCLLFFMVSCDEYIGTLEGNWKVTITYSDGINSATNYAVWYFDISDRTIEWWIDTDALHEPTTKQCLAWDGFEYYWSRDELWISGTGIMVGGTPCGHTHLVNWISFDGVQGEVEKYVFHVEGRVLNSGGGDWNVEISGTNID